MKLSDKLGCFCLVAAVLPLLAWADVPCGRGLRSIVALRCGDDPAVSLHCAPPIEDSDTCSLVNSIWARSFCRGIGEAVAEPSLTGCFSEADGPWDLLGVTIADPRKFCRSFPVTLSDAALASLTTSDSFEGPDPLAAWTLEISDIDDGDSISVICGDDFLEPDYSEGEGVTSADDGNCAAEVQAGCEADGQEGDYNTGYEYDSINGGTNRLSRTFSVLNTGCTKGMGSYKLQFAVFWNEIEFCDDSSSATFQFNDRAAIRATVSGGPEEKIATFTACDNPRAGQWETLEVPLGEVPLGTALSVDLEFASTNIGDCLVDSAILVDNLVIVPA